MLHEPIVLWPYVIAFLLLGLASLGLALQRRRSAVGRVGQLLHAAMCFAMAAMPATFFMQVWWLWAFGFLAAALWFVWLAVTPRPVPEDACGCGDACGPECTCDEAGEASRDGAADSVAADTVGDTRRAGRGMAWYHAFMMAAMSWMTWIMLPMQAMRRGMTGMSGAADGGMDTMSGSADGMSGMSGTDMSSGGGMAESASAGHTMMITMLPTWMLVITVAVVAVFAVAFVWWLWRAVRPGATVEVRLHAWLQAIMAAGMAFGFLAM